MPFDILNQYMSPLTLAIWFMDDGSGLNKGVKLATHGFTQQECQLLIDLLQKTNFVGKKFSSFSRKIQRWH